MNERLAQRCREFVFAAAKKYGLPPVVITAHTRWVQADRARLEVQRRMIDELGMKRWQVAKIFGRDVRRVRASVLNKERRRCHFDSKLMVQIGCQMVWAPCAPVASEPKKICFGIRPIPSKVIESLDSSDRAKLLEFLEAQRERVLRASPVPPVRQTRKSVVGI